MRPVTAKSVLVMKPSIISVPVVVGVRLSGIDIIEAKQRIRESLTSYFAGLAPGEELVLSKIEAVISNINGIADRRITSPTNNLIIDISNRMDWFFLGEINVTEI